MKSLFDTSVLLPCFFEDHIHHEPSLRAFLRANKNDTCCAAHSLAELYSSATRFPGKNRLSSQQALLFVETVVERLTVVSLTSEEYFSLLREAAAIGLVGGTIYDALIARCADKAGAEFIYTWNVKHFQQFSPDFGNRLRTP